MPFVAANRELITGLSAGQWNRNVDLSSFTTVPPGAIAAVIENFGPVTSGQQMGCQSADATVDLLPRTRDRQHISWIVHMGAGNLIDLYLGNAGNAYYITGFITSGGFFADRVDVSSQLTTVNTWEPIDLSAIVPVEAKYACVEFWPTADNRNCNYRQVGSSLGQNVNNNYVKVGIVELDASRVFEARNNVITDPLYITGWLEDGDYSYDETVAASAANTGDGTYNTYDFSASVPADINCALVEYTTGSNTAARGFRRDVGSTNDQLDVNSIANAPAKLIVTPTARAVEWRANNTASILGYRGGFLEVAAPKTASVRLADLNGNDRANLATVPWAWYDGLPVAGLGPTDTGTGSTDANGNMTVDIPNSALTAGGVGYLVTDTGAWQAIHAVTVVQT